MIDVVFFVDGLEPTKVEPECRSCGYPNLPGGPSRDLIGRRPDGHADFCQRPVAS